MSLNLPLIIRRYCQLQPPCRIFAGLAEFFAGSVAEIHVVEVKRWLELKRLQKKQASLPPLFLAHFEGCITSINKRVKRSLLLQKN
jgi:hypothetical protein